VRQLRRGSRIARREYNRTLICCNATKQLNQIGEVLSKFARMVYGAMHHDDSEARSDTQFFAMGKDRSNENRT
jgi:hypothetical protein